MSTTIESLMLLVGADVKPALAGLNKVSTSIASFASGTIGIANGIGSAIMSVGKSFMDLADNDIAKGIASMTRFASATGSSIETLTGFQMAGGQSFEDFSDTMMKLSKTLAGLELNSDAVSKKLGHFGIDAEKLAGMPLDKKLFAIADAFEKLGDTNEKGALLLTLFGKSGLDMMKVFQKGRAGINAEIQKGKDFGLSFAADQGKDIADAVKSVKEFKLLKEGFKKQFVLNTASMAMPVASLFTTVGVSLLKGLRLAWDAARPFKVWLEQLERKGAAKLGEWIGGGITAIVKKASELLPIVDAWASVLFAAGEAIGRWDGLWDGIKAIAPVLGVLDINLASIKDQAMLTAWAFEYGFNNSGKAIDIFNANIAVAGGKIALFASDFKDVFGTAFAYVKDIGEWAVTGLGTLFDRMLGNMTIKFKALGNALEKFLKDPTAGWQYTAPATADYTGAWGAMPKPRDVSTLADKAAKEEIKAAIEFAKLKANALEAEFGKGLFNFVKIKKEELKTVFGTNFLGFNLKDFIGGQPAINNFADNFAGQLAEATESKFAGVSLFGSQEAIAAVARFRFNTNDANLPDSPERQALLEQKRQLAEQKRANDFLKTLVEITKPTIVFGIP